MKKGSFVMKLRIYSVKVPTHKYEDDQGCVVVTNHFRHEAPECPSGIRSLRPPPLLLIIACSS